MENDSEDVPLPPPRGEASSPAASYGQQSTATLTPSPREESRPSEDIPRLHHFDMPQLPRRLPCGPVPVPRAPSPPLTQSNPNLAALETSPDASPAHRPGHRREPSQGAAHSADNLSSAGPGRAHNTSSDSCHTPPGQKSRAKKKSSKTSQYRRDMNQGALPPPPEPPPGDELPQTLPFPVLDCSRTSLERDGSAPSSMERRPEHLNHHRKASASRHRDENDIIPYSKPNFLSRGQMSSNCSTTGSSSSRGSTGSRGQGAGRSRTVAERNEVMFCLKINGTDFSSGRAHNTSSDSCHTPPGQKSRAKKKSSKTSQYRRDINQGALPPPPEPPPGDELPQTLPVPGLDCSRTSLERDGSAPSSMERRPEHLNHHRKASASRHRDENDIIPYSKPNFLSRGQMSSNCSTTGSSSSRGSTGSRGQGAGRSRTAAERNKPDWSCAHVKADVKNTLTGIGYLDAHPRPKSKVTQAPVTAVMCLASRVSTGSIKASAHTKGSTRDPVSDYDLPVTAVDFICSTWAELINRPLMNGIPFVQSWFVLHQPHQPPP
ncbi:UNVERIFIED_CONTAM: hypothetical protein FKN15_063538 [Acipenser sinensis]